jgi:hypothetical protein
MLASAVFTLLMQAALPFSCSVPDQHHAAEDEDGQDDRLHHEQRAVPVERIAHRFSGRASRRSDLYSAAPFSFSQSGQVGNGIQSVNASVK